MKEQKNMGEELIDRIDYERRLIETLNKIVQKLNFERKEAEHKS